MEYLEDLLKMILARIMAEFILKKIVPYLRQSIKKCLKPIKELRLQETATASEYLELS